MIFIELASFFRGRDGLFSNHYSTIKIPIMLKNSRELITVVSGFHSFNWPPTTYWSVLVKPQIDVKPRKLSPTSVTNSLKNELVRCSDVPSQKLKMLNGWLSMHVHSVYNRDIFFCKYWFLKPANRNFGEVPIRRVLIIVLYKYIFQWPVLQVRVGYDSQLEIIVWDLNLNNMYSKTLTGGDEMIQFENALICTGKDGKCF
jgi:hypothetical protein